MASEKRKVRVAVVLPRYGNSIGGGAETLVRELLLRWHRGELGDAPQIAHCEVWTTCAMDHRTWDNFYKAGLYEEDGLHVHRFAVDSRDTGKFIGYELQMASGWPLNVEEQLSWMSESVNSSGLYQHIARNAQDYDYLIFAPYLFATSFWGALIAPEKSVLLPCLHDERYAYLDVIREQFYRVSGIIFNAEAERDLASRLYGAGSIEEKGTVVGMGFDIPGEIDSADRDAVLAKFSSNIQEGDKSNSAFPIKPRHYLLYSGRKEEGKNLDVLIRYYSAMREAGEIEIPLVLIGSGRIEFLECLPQGVVDLGFVSEEEKAVLFSGASLLVQPSVNESFSIVLMESWLRRTPVLVHANCDVTREHAVSSGGGLYFASEVEFRTVVKHLLDSPELLQLMGESGYQYVTTVYSWKAVGERLAQALKKIDCYRASLAQADEAPLLGGVG